MTPLAYYEQLLAAHLKADAQQAQIIPIFNELFLQLCAREHWLSRLKKIFHLQKPLQGIYLHGRVGSGKTLIMDIFEHCLPAAMTLRMHFHAFMQLIHDELRQVQAQQNPIRQVVKKLAKQARVLCLDELIVHDIADAMILGELFRHLIHSNIVLVITTNSEPDDLYKNGLQRQRFEPAIALLKAHTQVIGLNTPQDYRQYTRSHTSYYFTPLNATTDAQMQQVFTELTQGQQVTATPLLIDERYIAVRARSDTVVWFDFHAICGVPRSQRDYLLLAQQFRVVLVSNIPAIARADTNLARAFINLIDVLYDHQMRLIVSAAVPITALYPVGRLALAFARTASRLTQMQYGK